MALESVIAEQPLLLQAFEGLRIGDQLLGQRMAKACAVTSSIFMQISFDLIAPLFIDGGMSLYPEFRGNG